MTALRYRLLDLALQRQIAPDLLLRFGTRTAASRKLRRLRLGGLEAMAERKDGMAIRARSGPVAEDPHHANEQHYELPAEFMALFLGPRMKYSACWWPDTVRDLGGAEEAMLDVTTRRARVSDGMSVLDLGCGWGALTCWLLENYDVEVTAVSNSERQAQWIKADCERRGVAGRVRVVTADINTFEPTRTFDRIISIEMFEHLRNWHELLKRAAGWLTPDGLMLLHVFSHREFAYLFEGTWAAERFFSSGTMPSHDLLLRTVPAELDIERVWQFDGTHYSRTISAWLDRFDQSRDELVRVLRANGHTNTDAQLLVGTWRLFLLSTAEMWGLRKGQEWGVSHYLLRRTVQSSKVDRDGESR